MNIFGKDGTKNIILDQILCDLIYEYNAYIFGKGALQRIIFTFMFLISSSF